MHKHLLIFTVIGLLFSFVPSSASAQLVCQLEGVGLTSQVVECVEGVLKGATISLLEGMSDLPVLNDWLTGLLVLYTLFFGFRVVTGETELTKKVWEWLIKFGLVILFSNNLGGFAPGILAAMDALQGIVIDNLSSTIEEFSCKDSVEFEASGLNALTTGSSMVWAHVDCLLLRVFGFGGDGLTFGSAIMGIVSAALFSGTMGVMVFTMGIMALMAILSLAYRAVLGYLLSYALVSIMIIISPLIVPLMLFTTTTAVFDAWRRAIMGAVFLPAFITAYMLIALPLLNYAIIDANGSLEKIIPREELAEAHRNEAPKCSQRIAEITAEDSANQQSDGDVEAADDRDNDLNPFLSLASDICKFFPFASLDLGLEHDSKMMRLGMALLSLFVISWLVKKMLESVVSLATFLMRGGHAINSVMSGGGTMGRYVARATGGTGI